MELGLKGVIGRIARSTTELGLTQKNRIFGNFNELSAASSKLRTMLIIDASITLETKKSQKKDINPSKPY